MALNKYMHLRNPFRTKPNFQKLAENYDFFREAVAQDEKGKFVVDFKQPKQLAALSKAILLSEFNLEVDFPLDRMIPTVPLRMNYILWIEDLLSRMPNVLYYLFILDTKFDQGSINILDIGVGASCIYPLLGARKNDWNFVGTEIDARSFSFAIMNVFKNRLEDKIKLLRATDSGSYLGFLFGADTCGTLKSHSVPPCSISMTPFIPPTYIHIVMANPPFFADASDEMGLNSSRSMVRSTPKTASAAARHESQAPGGEVCFAMRLAKESLVYRDRIGQGVSAFFDFKLS
ncbi:unnamed protein product [Protopolystoma xenopodis]|uniref:U6 snRNA m(6)A methyltransferase n=1 Tax=Protopolystoma xenopodis TaxID=117903 RepID=A0A3S5B1Q4_9PLAT|nr:unnamed protein product [Protopolystoma xenopodis]